MSDNGHDPRIDATDSYPLDDATIALFDETLQQIRAFNAYREGVLGLFLRQHGLTVGEWKLGANGKELVRAQQVQPPKQPEPPSDLEQQLAESIKNVKRS